MLFIPVLLLVSATLIGTVHGQHSKPVLVNNTECLVNCKGKGGLCEEVCGAEGYCCRRGYGDCLQTFEDVAPKVHYACIKGTEYIMHEEAIQVEKCKVNILQGNHMIRGNTIFGTLDTLGEEFAISFDFEPLINSTGTTEYMLIFYSKDRLGKGGRFYITGTNGEYQMQFCGSLSGIEADGKSGCYPLGSVKTNQRKHVHIHQVNDHSDIFSQKAYVDHSSVYSGRDLMPERLRNVAVVGLVIPKQVDAGRLGNVVVGACGSTFDRSQKAT